MSQIIPQWRPRRRWALWETEYTDVLYEAMIELYDPENGMYEGLYERGQGRVSIFTANNNGIILTALLHKVQGTILTPYTGDTEVWYTAFRDQDIRLLRHYPDPPRKTTGCPLCVIQYKRRLISNATYHAGTISLLGRFDGRRVLRGGATSVG